MTKDTAFFFGAEIMANQMDAAVVYASIKNVKKGKYEIELTLITDQPKSESYGYITQSSINLLEKDINKNPEFWLWSHKRWKMDLPEDLEKVKKEHKDRFEAKFR